MSSRPESGPRQTPASPMIRPISRYRVWTSAGRPCSTRRPMTSLRGSGPSASQLADVADDPVVPRRRHAEVDQALARPAAPSARGRAAGSSRRPRSRSGGPSRASSRRAAASAPRCGRGRRRRRSASGCGRGTRASPPAAPAPAPAPPRGRRRPGGGSPPGGDGAGRRRGRAAAGLRSSAAAQWDFFRCAARLVALDHGPDQLLDVGSPSTLTWPWS